MKSFNQFIKSSKPYLLLIGLVVVLSSCVQKNLELSEVDWPQFKKDNYRSASINMSFDAATLGQAWVYEASQEPVPAWYGPAKEDAFANSGTLPSMRDYDLAYYPIVIGSNLFYGSSADDALHCLDSETGKEKWIYNANGPIRVAPTFYNGNLYFGSDDGYVHCINATSGKLKWKFSPSPEDYQLVFNNGRFISFWPIRTGVLIENGIAYFGASLLPWKESYVCAVNIETGKTDIPGTYVKEHNDVTLEGSMASTGKLLIQPQGRISPIFIQKSDGEKAGQLAGTGGCFVLVTPDQHVIHGDKSRFKSLVDAEVDRATEKNPEFMTYKDGKEMLVKGDTSYVLNDNSIAAYHQGSKKMLWLKRNYQAHRIILIGDVLIAGGTDKVYAISTKNGLPLWEGKVEGTVYALAAANNSLYASTNKGKIYSFRSGNSTSDLYAENVNEEAIIDGVPPKEEKKNEVPTLEIKSGPFVHALTFDSISIEFETAEPVIIAVDWSPIGISQTKKESKALTNHQFKFPVQKNYNYSYELSNNEGETAKFYYDNFFNTKQQEILGGVFPDGGSDLENEVSSFINSYPKSDGFCLVLGDESEKASYELAANTNLKVINLDDSQKNIRKFKNILQDNKVYGPKISGLAVKDINNIPITSELADLVWVNNTDGIDADEVIRLIAPKHHALIRGVSDTKEWLENSLLSWQVEAEKYGDNSIVLTKNPIENTGSWTHMYGSSDNSSFGGESLWGSNSTEDFEVQWMGRPGPRFQTDRNGRKPSPLAIDGRLFVQGNERVASVNMYNGTIHWVKEFPGMKRMNVSRDCSNWAVDKSFIYMVNNEKLNKVDQKNGDVVKTISVNNYYKGEVDWSYIGVLQDRLIGGATAKDASHINYHGSTGWYDAKKGPLAAKVLSYNLFAIAKEGDKEFWNYKPKGAIINPTITSYNDQIAFVETRSPNKESIKTARGGAEIFKKTWLVALDVQTGEKIWETPVKTKPGLTTYYMAAGDGKYVIVSSAEGSYDVRTYNSSNGTLSWKKDQQWFHGDHGGHMSKPAIVDNRLMIKPALYNMETGEVIDYNVPKVGHGCAHYALTEQSVFYRGGSVAQFNFDTRSFSKWERLRPDCWLSTIPAGGMVLSPEAGGGCSCGNWLETSMVMAPISRTPITIKSLGETSIRDYKQETWGDYVHECNFNEFVDSVKIELSVRPGVEGVLVYTTDGSNPNKNSNKYSEPFVVSESTNVKAAIFIQKGGEERRFIRTQQFSKIGVNKEIADNLK